MIILVETMVLHRRNTLILAVFISACTNSPRKESARPPSPTDATVDKLAIPTSTKSIDEMGSKNATTAHNPLKDAPPHDQVPPQDGPRILDFSKGDLVHELNEATVKTNPMAILMMKNPPFSDPEKIISLMKHNVALFSYLPDKLRKQKKVQEAAIALGIQQGLVMTEDYHARVRPSHTATLAYDKATAPNGYIAEGRPPQKQKKGDLLAAIETKSVNGENWYLIKRAMKSTKAADDKEWGDAANVGGVKREDFSLSVDPGWIPAKVTHKAITAQQYVSGLYTYDSAQNGDLSIYVSFQEDLGFEGFGPEYDFLFAEEKGLISKGDQIRVIWKKSARSKDSPEIIWTPLPEADFDQ
jgi:hypothetical protein